MAASSIPSLESPRTEGLVGCPIMESHRVGATTDDSAAAVGIQEKRFGQSVA